MSTKDIILDVMNDIDPKFIKEHMDRANVTGFRKFIRFATPVAIYAVACIAVLFIIPFITGKPSADLPEPPSHTPILNETQASSDTEYISEQETENTVNPENKTETETKAESDIESETETEEITIIETETEAVIDQTTSPEDTTELLPIETTPEESETVTKPKPEPDVEPDPEPDSDPDPEPKPEPKPEPVPEPKNMQHVTGVPVPYSYLWYDGYSALDFSDTILSNPVFTNTKDFKQLADQWKSIAEKETAYKNPVDKAILADIDYFNEAFFRTHNLYIECIGSPSGSISFGINKVSISENGTFSVVFNRYDPMWQTGDYNEIYVFFAVEKSIAQNALRAEYSYNTYLESYNPYTGEGKYVLEESLSESILTYGVSDVLDVGDIPTVVRDENDLTSLLGKVSSACGDNIGAYFDAVPLEDVDLGEFGYVYVGIHDSTFINDNNKIQVTLSSRGVLEILVPVEAVGGEKHSGNLKMYVLKLPKKIMDMTREVKVVEILSVEPVGDTMACPKCGLTRSSEDIWVTKLHPEYKQSGKLFIMVKNDTTREIFKISPNTIDEVKKRFFSNIKYEYLDSEDYSGNPDFVQEIISGEFIYKIMISVTLEDKSIENIKKVLEGFGCYRCSPFYIVSVSY